MTEQQYAIKTVCELGIDLMRDYDAFQGHPEDTPVQKFTSVDEAIARAQEHWEIPDKLVSFWIYGICEIAENGTIGKAFQIFEGMHYAKQKDELEVYFREVPIDSYRGNL